MRMRVHTPRGGQSVALAIIPQAPPPCLLRERESLSLGSRAFQ